MEALTDSQHSLTYTVSYSKISCIKEMYFIHTTTSWLTGIVGIVCFLSRVVPVLAPFHLSAGRAYIILMVWNTAFSLVVHNTGLPMPVLISFFFVLSGMTIGWIVIKAHQAQLQEKVILNVNNKLKTQPKAVNETFDLQKEMDKERKAIVEAKTFKERFISYKTLHGVLMLISWYSIIARVFASNPGENFQCHTYPAYKVVPGNRGHPEYKDGDAIVMVPEVDPNYARLPWADKEWLFGIGNCFVFPLAVGLAVGAWASHRNSKGAKVVTSDKVIQAAAPALPMTGVSGGI